MTVNELIRVLTNAACEGRGDSEVVLRVQTKMDEYEPVKPAYVVNDDNGDLLICGFVDGVRRLGGSKSTVAADAALTSNQEATHGD